MSYMYGLYIFVSLSICTCLRIQLYICKYMCISYISLVSVCMNRPWPLVAGLPWEVFKYKYRCDMVLLEYTVSAALGKPLGIHGLSLGRSFRDFALSMRTRIRKYCFFGCSDFKICFYTTFHRFRKHPGRRDHGFRMGEVFKITLSSNSMFHHFGIYLGFVLEPKTP